MKIRNLLIIILFAFVLIGCGGSKPEPETPEDNEVNYEIEISESTISLYVGQTYEVNPTVEGLEDAEFNYAITDQTIISMERNVITGVAAGQTTVEITLQDNKDVKAILTVSVSDIPSVEITGPTKVYVGETITLEATLNGVEGTVVWTVDDDEVAYIDNGVLEGLEKGEIVVRASCGNYSAVYEIQVKEKPQLRINGKKNVEVGSNLQLTASTKNVEGDVVWSSANESIATVDQNGLVTPVSGGTVEITITYEEFSASTEITVLVPTISVSGPTQIYVGETATYTALLQNTLESYTIEWSTSEEEVATIANGVLTPLAEGTVKVIASAAGTKAEIEVEVLLRKEVSISGKSIIYMGDEMKLEISLLNVAGDILFKSSNELVATVDSLGTVTATGVGKTTISATCGGVTGTFELEVQAMVDKITYKFNGGASEELYIAEDVKVTLTANNNKNYWGEYATSIFLFTKSSAINATFSDRISIGKDKYTGYYQVLDVCKSGTAVWPEGTEYIIVISSSYNNAASIRSKVDALNVGDYVFFEKSPATVSSTNPCNVYFCSPEISVDQFSVLKEDYNGTLVTPARLGYEFLGWYDKNDNKVASLTKDQIVGKVELTAKWNALNPVTDITVNNVPSEMLTEETFKINAAVVPSDAFFKEVIFSTSNYDIVNVTEDGLLTAMNAGTATITIKDYLGEIVKTFEITVYSQPSIDISFPDGYIGVLEIGQTLQLEPTYLGKQVDDIAYTYSSSNPAVASVDASGLITAVANGTVEIHINANTGKTLKIGLTVAGLTEEDKVDQVIKLIAENNFAEVEAGNACLYNDGKNRYYKATYGSVNRFLFDDLDIDRTYASVAEANSNGHRSRRFTGGFDDSIEFVTVHDTATLSGTTKAIADNMSSGSTSIHYAVGNYEVYEVVPEKYIAYHAGDGTGTPFKWNATGVKATANVAPEYDITKVNGTWYFVLNGQTSKIVAPISNGTKTIANPSKANLSHLGPVWKIVDGEYYIGNTWVCFSQVAAGVIGSFGGNNNSIGIEMSVNTTNDMYDTYQRTAKLVADILIRNNLDLTRVKQHNTWTGKNCPQSIIAGNYWEDFMKMVEIEYILAKDYSDVEISIQSDNPEIVDNTGRVVKAPSVTTTVGYTVTVKSGSTTKTIKLYSVVPGSTSWEQWNGTYLASLIWNKGEFVVNK